MNKEVALNAAKHVVLNIALHAAQYVAMNIQMKVTQNVALHEALVIMSPSITITVSTIV